MCGVLRNYTPHTAFFFSFPSSPICRFLFCFFSDFYHEYFSSAIGSLRHFFPVYMIFSLLVLHLFDFLPPLKKITFLYSNLSIDVLKLSSLGRSSPNAFLYPRGTDFSARHWLFLTVQLVWASLFQSGSFSLVA